jgi:pimeloyl-ACP methyl ester carboxylesterase
MEISYDDRGHGDPALLCLPGWCGDRSVFAPLLDSLATRRRTLALDWRGHGDSERDVADFGSPQLVEDAVHVIEAADAGPVIPVALAHAGWVAIELRRRLGAERVPAIVLIDWMVLGTPPGFGDALVGLQDSHAWQDVRAALFGMWTTGVDSPAVLGYVSSMAEYGYAHWSRAGREIAASFDREGTPLTALQALAGGGEPCPTLHAYAQPEDPGVLAAQEAYAAAHPWFTVRRLPARSHFPTLEIPEAMADIIDDFVASVAAPRSEPAPA